jgi:N-acetylmuramoyl-L-alanine amidase
LEGLKDNGTRWGSMSEADVNLAIVRATAALLEKKGYVVEILPAVVPRDYRAHLFLSIHADGAASATATGFRVSAPRRDATGRGGGFASLLETSYARATGLRLIPDPTRRMEMYYAFNFRRYEHALHPMTIAASLEPGYLTSASDRRIIVDDPDRVARGIVEAIVAFPETPPPKGF